MRNALFRYIAMASASIALSLASGGCSGDEFDVPEQSADGVAIHFYSTRQTTRATGDQEPGINDLNENKLTSLAVALYPLSAGDDTPATKFQVFTGFNDEGSHTERISLKKEEIAALFGADAPTGSQCKVYAVANLSVETLERIKGGTPSISALKNLEITSDFSSKQTQQSFVMSGNGLATFTSAGDNSSATGDIPLYRTAAKITLNVKLPEKVQESEGSDVYWYPLENNGTMRVLLNNGVNKSTVVADVSNILSDGYFDINTNNDNTWGFTDNSTENPEYKWKQTYPFYTYPNKWENTPSEMHRTTLTLIIPWQKGNADGPTETTYETFYYSVPVTATELTELTSNYSYQIDLNVNMLGSRAPEQPEEINGNYKVVDWMTENMDVNIKDYRYLIVNPKTYDVNNLEEFKIPLYSSHDIMVEDISISYSRFNALTGDNGEVIDITVPKDVINNSTIKKTNSEGEEYTDSLCNYFTTYDPNIKQYYVHFKHALKIWLPVNNGEIVPTQDAYSSVQAAKNAIESATSYQPSNPEVNAYSQYTIKITIRHKDNKNFTETITFNQFPAMYIQAKPNEGGEYNTGRLLGNTANYNPSIAQTTDYGFVFVNPTYYPEEEVTWSEFVGWSWGRPQYETKTGIGPAYWTNSTTLGSVSGLAGDNKNPNMYVITVSKLNETDDLYIGDPRLLYKNNSLNTDKGAPLDASKELDGAPDSDWSQPSFALYPLNSGKRGLSHYYPTDERTDNIYKLKVAPKFRVASSYGKTYEVNRTNARRRCATYQEQDNPAGRWRIPTYGEIEYITTLSSLKRIPVLFTVGSTYWSAQGPVTVNTDGTLTLETSISDNHYVRCVYDEWYWEDEKNYQLVKNNNGMYDYTYGDMPKRNPQN